MKELLSELPAAATNGGGGGGGAQGDDGGSNELREALSEQPSPAKDGAIVPPDTGIARSA